MPQKHPHTDATYRIVPLDGAGFGVEVSIPDSSPAMITSFPTREAPKHGSPSTRALKLKQTPSLDAEGLPYRFTTPCLNK